MTAKLIFILLLSLLPLAAVVVLLRSGRLDIVRQWLSHSEKRMNFAASLLSIVILIFHLAYSLAMPVSLGLAMSSLYAFFSIAVKRNTRLLLFIRTSKKTFAALAAIAVVIGFIHGMFPVAFTMAVILVTAFCFPDKISEVSSTSDTTNIV